MLIPAAVLKVINFHDNQGNSSPVAKQGFNYIKAMLDNGSIINVEISSNDPSFSESLKDFISFKAKSITKENEMKQAAYDLMFSTDPDIVDKINRAEVKIKDKNTNMKPAQLRKTAGEAVAAYLVSMKRTIKAASIIRLAFGTPYDSGPQIYKSRAIQVSKNEKNEKGFGNGGLYYFAQTGNVIPIEITQIRNRDGIFSGYFRVSTGKLINALQIDFLIDHSIRTIREYMSKGQKPFLLQLLRHEGQQNVPPVYYNTVMKLNNIEKQNRASENPLMPTLYEEYIQALESLKSAMQADNKLYGSFRAALPLVYTNKDLDSAIDTVSKEKGASPMQNMPKAISNLNFSKENPDIKKQVETYVYNYVKGIASGQYNFKVLGTISFSAQNILGEAKSWGFPLNNIDSSKFTLSFESTKMIIEHSYQMVDQLKGSSRG